MSGAHKEKLLSKNRQGPVQNKKRRMSFLGQLGSDGEGIAMYFDIAITRFFKSLGFKWYGQGMDLESGIRDISFEKEES
jgi:hypothetical protein